MHKEMTKYISQTYTLYSLYYSLLFAIIRQNDF